MTRWGDNFNRADTSSGLGSLPGGGPNWQPLIGSWRIFQNRAYTANAPDNALVVADFGEPSFEITLYATGGDAIYARVANASNWVRCRVRKYQVFPTGQFRWDIRIEQSFNGGLTNLRHATLTSYGGWLRFRGKGTSLSAYVASSLNGFPNTPVVTANSTHNLDVPFHGFGRGPSELSEDYWFDNFTYDSLNTAPLAPTLLFPPNGATIDLNAQSSWRWRFNDEDPGDHQSRFEARWRLTGSQSWLVTSLSNYPTEGMYLGAGALPEGAYEWQVRTWDSDGVVGSWSASSFVTLAEVDSPTILSPASGSVIDRDSVFVQWSAAEQSFYEVRSVPGLTASEPDVNATPYYTSGVVTSTGTRSHTVPLPENERTEWILVRTGVGSPSSIVWSQWGFARVDVAYTPPAVPAVRITTNEASASIIVSAIHPAKTVEQPDVTSIRVHRRPVGDTGAGERIPASYLPVSFDAAPNRAVVDYLPASGTEYEYRVEARAANDSASFSAWLTGRAGFSTYGTATYGQATYVGGE